MTTPENKLHLGCGKKKIHGYINVDANQLVNPDVIDDCIELKTFKEKTIDVIYACHILEHFIRERAKLALTRWYQLLKPNGVLRISVPDLKAIFEYYQTTNDIAGLQNLLYGDQKDQFNYHYVGYDEVLLKEILFSIGFKDIKRYDWQDTEHFYIDDYSQCYLPKISYSSRRKGSKVEGKLVSLNLEAIK